MAHFAPQAEQEWFAKQLDEEQAFYRCWCLREAVLKSQGVGIVKLSSVTHLPEQLQIFSDYCSKGELLFTADSLADLDNYDSRDWGSEAFDKALELCLAIVHHM